MKPIRVLCLFTILDRGGAETMCMNLYRHIDRSKLQFDFLVYHPEKGMYDDEVESLGGHVYRIPHPKHPYAHMRGAREFFRNHPEYQIVHNHMQSNGAIICREARRADVRTIIYHSHFAPREEPALSIPAAIRRIIDEVADKATIRSSNEFFACGVAARKLLPDTYDVRILHNAIDLKAFDFDSVTRMIVRQEMRCSNKLVIGNVARLGRDKNHAFLINVFARLKQRELEAELWLVGDGALRSQLEKQVGKMGLQEHVRFLGVRTDVGRLLQAMDVFVFPSIAEGLPVACIEAQAAGLPCLLSDGIDSYTAVTASCSFLSLADSVETWADKAQALSARPRVSTLAELRAAGYDINETASQMQSFYLERCGS